MLGIVYFQGNAANPGVMSTPQDTAIKVATSAGTVLGQLGFGALADIVGRKKMYGLELIVMIVAVLAQALSSASPSVSIIGVIIFWRVIMGIGIGGDYPLSSIITSEFATTKWRGAMMGAVFAMQGIGQMAGALVMLIVTKGFEGSLRSSTAYGNCGGVCGLAVDKMWRVLIGFGAVPGCIALYFRLTIPETPRYTFDVQRDVEQAVADQEKFNAGKHGTATVDAVTHAQGVAEGQALTVPKASWKDFFAFYGRFRNFRVLFGTAFSWFTLDVAFYGLGLNSSTVLQAINYGGGATTYQKLYNLAAGNCILIIAGAIPGYWVTVALVDTVGRKPIQLMGFTILTILFCIWGFAYEKLSGNAQFALYVLVQFFFNFGPNATTFIVPGECFPTRYRSTSHGISAASGKIGSIIAQAAIAPLRTRGATKANANPWLNHVMQIFALFMLLGIFSTLLIPETKRKTLEDLANDWDMGNESITGHEHAKRTESDEGSPVIAPMERKN